MRDLMACQPMAMNDILDAARSAQAREHQMSEISDFCLNCGRSALAIMNKRLLCGPRTAPTCLRQEVEYLKEQERIQAYDHWRNNGGVDGQADPLS